MNSSELKEQFFELHEQKIKSCSNEELVELLVDHADRMEQLDHDTLVNWVLKLDREVIYQNGNDELFNEMINSYRSI